MKHFNLNLLNVITFSLLSVSTFAQNWLQGWNGAFPPAWDVSIPANQLLGTTTNFPLKFITNGTQRMTVWDDSYSGPTWGTPFGGGVTINYDPANPIVQPLSLLTIGDNIGSF